MKLLSNENFPLTSVLYLKKAGYYITHVCTDFKGISDIEVLQRAHRQSRTIITFDKDYGELIYKYGIKPSEGIIFLRINNFTPYFPGKLIHRLLYASELNFTKKLTVIDKNSVRQRIYE